MQLAADLALQIRIKLGQLFQIHAGVQGPVGQDGPASAKAVVAPANIAVQLQALLAAFQGGGGGQGLLAYPALQSYLAGRQGPLFTVVVASAVALHIELAGELGM